MQQPQQPADTQCISVSGSIQSRRALDSHLFRYGARPLSFLDSMNPRIELGVEEMMHSTSKGRQGVDMQQQDFRFPT